MTLQFPGQCSCRTWDKSGTQGDSCTHTADNPGSVYCRTWGRTGSPPQPRIHSEDNALTRSSPSAPVISTPTSLPHFTTSADVGSIGKVALYFRPSYFPPGTLSTRSTPLEQHFHHDCATDFLRSASHRIKGNAKSRTGYLFGALSHSMSVAHWSRPWHTVPVFHTSTPLICSC